MRILLLNCRDIKNPSAGGAEINTYETLRHLAKTHEVWQFSSAFPGCKKEERYDGINVIRRGNFLVVFLGRLKRAKKPDDALAAMKKIHEKIPSMQGIIMGEGYLREEIGKNAPEYVQVLGKVAQQRKVEILKSASLLLVPGVREGWGLVVIEANSFGTPCVGYGIDGLRDSIVDGKTGVLVECNPDAMADAAVKMLQDGKRRRELGENCLEWSRNFSWEKSAKGFQKIIEVPFLKIARHKKSGHEMVLVLWGWRNLQ